MDIGLSPQDTDAFRPGYLADLLAGLTGRVLEAAGRRARAAITGTDKEQALSRCLQAGLVAFLATATPPVPDEAAVLEDVAGEFFTDPDVGKELGELLRGQVLDADELATLFAESGYDHATLPGLDFAGALDAFQVAFLTAAAEEPVLQGTIRVHQLIAQTKIQRDLLAAMRDLVDLLRGVKPDTLAIVAGQVIGRAAEDDRPIIFQVRKRSANAGNSHYLRESYLNRVFEAARHLPLEGVDQRAAQDSRASLHLDAVYTALVCITPEHNITFGLGGPIGEETPASALERVDEHQHLVLLGDPGSGKSSFGNFVVLCLAGEGLGRPEANLACLTAPLPIGGQDQSAWQPWGHGALLPVRVVLRDFAARGLPEPGEQPTANDLWSFVAGDLERWSLGEYAPHLRQELLEQGGFIFFDGLDEVPEAEQRRSQIIQAVSDFVATFHRCRVLVTSRTYAYVQQNWRLGDFAEAELAPFDDPQIRLFIARWYAHIAEVRGLSQDDAIGRVGLLEQAVFENSRLRELAARPLLLTLMASLHAWRGGSLPERREELYADAVDLLLEAWESQRVVRDASGQAVIIQPSLVEFLQVDRGRLRRLLNELAFEAHAGQSYPDGTADILEDTLVARLVGLSASGDVRPRRLVEYLSDRAGLLLPYGAGVYRFPHRTFQEYLAACHLTDRADFPYEAAKLAHNDPDRWREVILLAGAKAARGASWALWPLVEALCAEEPRASCDPPAAGIIASAAVAGELVVESADPNAIPALHRAMLDRLRRWHVALLRCELLPEVAVARTSIVLAYLGDPRPEVMTLEEMEFCLIPAGSFIGSNRVMTSISYPYWIARLPVTVAHYEVFLDAGGYAEPRYWMEAEEARVWSDGRILSRYGGYGATFPHEWDEQRRLPNYPIRGVTWYEATAFARWLRECWADAGYLDADWTVRLPRENEWGKAACGGLEVPRSPIITTATRGFLATPVSSSRTTQANPHASSAPPWRDPDKAERHQSFRRAVGCFPSEASPYGVEDVPGSESEWTSSHWDEAIMAQLAVGSVQEFVVLGITVHVPGGGHPGHVPFSAASDSNGLGFRVVIAPARLDDD